MAFIPDEAVLRFHELTPAAIRVYSYYCLKRNKQTGGWNCPDAATGRIIEMSRSRVSEARKELVSKGWIESHANGVIKPLLGFAVENSTKVTETPNKNEDTGNQTVENSTNVEISTNVENSTLSPLRLVENSTHSVEISTAHIRNIPAQLPEEREDARAQDNFQTPFDDLSPQLSPVEDALRLAKRWPETLTPTQFSEIKRTAQALARYNGTATPERIAKIGDYYRAQNRPSWGMSWPVNDWPAIADWCATKEPKAKQAKDPEPKWEDLPEEYKARFRNL